MAWGQFALLGWAAVCFFAAGARSKDIKMTWRTWLEISQAALIVVVLFALLTEGRGCTSVPTAFDSDEICTFGNTGC